MARFHVHNATVSYVGLPYSGPYLEQIELPVQIDSAEFEDLNKAIECADKLQAVCDSGWLVVHTFHERVMHDSRNIKVS